MRMRIKPGWISLGLLALFVLLTVATGSAAGAECQTIGMECSGGGGSGCPGGWYCG